MKQLEMYIIYNITTGDLTIENWSEAELITREISLQSNNLIRKYIRFKGLKENSQHIENIIKVTLPKDFDKALETLNQGIDFLKKHYVPLLSSPTLMKTEEKDEYGEDNKCEYFFIAEEDKEFIEIFEDITSLGKLTQFRENENEICINKDVIARLALNTSSSYPVGVSPNMVVLPVGIYTTFNKYCYLSDDMKDLLEDEKEREVEHEFQDGCGLMSPKLAKKIQKALKVDYNVDFAVIRKDLLATKGLLVKVDFVKYFNEMYIKDTENFKKRKDGFYTVDYFGNWVNISEADMIVTPNMCKWSKHWKKENQVVDINKELKQELSKEKYDKYREILSNLYVTKINKQKPDEYGLTNYQLITNLALTPKELDQLQSPTYDMLYRVASNDIDSIRLMMGDMAKDKEDIELKTMDKIHYCIQATGDCLKNVFTVKQTVYKMIERKIRQLCQGKFYVKGHYKMVSACPITFMDFIMYRDLEQCTRGLKSNEYYVAQEQGKRVISRNPLNSFSEIQKINIARNELLEKYCGKLTSELFFLNQKDDTAMLMSGADEDGDMFFTIDNETIYNAVVEPKNGLHFINIQDNKESKTHKYTKQNEYYCVLKASGNKIGSIANLGSRINTQITELRYFRKEEYRINNKMFYTWKEFKKLIDETYIGKDKNELDVTEAALNLLENKLKEKKEQSKSIDAQGFILCELLDDIEYIENTLPKKKKKFKEAKNKFYNDKMVKEIEDNKFVRVIDASEDTIRALLKQQFYKNRKYSYKALQLQMIAIDQPKCLKEDFDEVVKKQTKDIKDEITEKNNPAFLKYMKDKKTRDKKYWSKTHSVLNLHAKKVAVDMFAKIHEDTAEDVSFFNGLLEQATLTDNTKQVGEEIAKIFLVYREVRSLINQQYNKDKLEQKRNNSYRNNNVKTSKKVKELLEKHGLQTMASAILNWSKQLKSETKSNTGRTKFMFECCFDVIQPLIDIKYPEVVKFLEDENGDLDWKFKKYKKIEGKRNNDNMQELENRKQELREGELLKIRCESDNLEANVIEKINGIWYLNGEDILNNPVGKRKHNVNTFDILDKLVGDKNKLEVEFKNKEIKGKYFEGYMYI